MPVIIAAVIAAAASAVGMALAAGDKAKARKIQEEAAAKINALGLPGFTDVKPEEVTESAFEKLSQPNPATNAENLALSSLTDTVTNRGNDAQFADEQRKIEAAAGRQNAGNVFAAQNRARQRGIGTQGLYAADLVDSQNSANQANAMSSDAASRMQQRYLDALRSLGGLGGNVRAGDQRAASAIDQINMFNAGQRQSAGEYNNELKQRAYAAAMQKAMNEANAMNGVAASYDASGDQARRDGAAIGKGALAVGQGVADYTAGGAGGYTYDQAEQDYWNEKKKKYEI